MKIILGPMEPDLMPHISKFPSSLANRVFICCRNGGEITLNWGCNRKARQIRGGHYDAWKLSGSVSSKIAAVI
jgi:hypothetical protein